MSYFIFHLIVDEKFLRACTASRITMMLLVCWYSQEDCVVLNEENDFLDLLSW